MTDRLFQAGVDPGNYGYSPFNNWMRGGLGLPYIALPNTPTTELYDEGRVDSNYELTTITADDYSFYYAIWGRPPSLDQFPDMAGKSMVAKWDDGEAVFTITGNNIANISVDLEARRATFTTGDASQNNGAFDISFGLNSAQGDGSPPRNIRVCEAGDEANLDDGQELNANWLNWNGRFPILRLMDPMGTNNSEAEDFDDLPTKDFRYWGGSEKSHGRKVGWPPAVLAELVNRTGNAIWINIPHKFTDEACTALATTLRDTISFDGSRIRLYVTFSNELWNDRFLQTLYARTQGAAAGWTTGDDVTKGRQWSGYQAARFMEIFRTVIGTDSGTLWAGVLEGFLQLPSSDFASLLTGVNRHISSDDGAASTVGKLFSLLAGAPYFGPNISDLSTGVGAAAYALAQQGQAAFDQGMYDILKLGAGVDNGNLSLDYWRLQWNAMKAVADANGLGTAWYEGGFGMVCDPASDPDNFMNTRIAKFASSELAGQLTYDMLMAFDEDTGGEGIGSQFVAMGPHNQFGMWGARQHFADLSARSNAGEAFSAGAPWQQRRRNLRVTSS